MSFDKNMFMSQRIADKNSAIMDMMFVMNKKLDNFMDYLDIVLVMNKLSSAIHKIAHFFPLDADIYRDYNALYSYRTKYGTIEGQYKDFNNIVEGVEDVLDYILDIDNTLADAKKLAREEDNHDYGKFISDQIESIRIYKKQFILLHDKVSKALSEGNTLQDIDNRYEDFMVIGD